MTIATNKTGTVRKVKAATWAAALAGAVVPSLIDVVGLPVPAEAETWLVGLVAAGLTAGATALATWASGYLTRPAISDLPVIEETDRVPIPAGTPVQTVPAP